ncbi:MAG: DNA-directed RNA polymerase subunit beta' [Clostridia bacterium]|nr:DNA-directed RNA polymerase subunit beta' [Clostridia bacterium]
MFELTNLDAIQIGMASPEQILAWSHGEVTKPETINYRTLRPERDGLYCERIFGPTKDWECACGKYKRIKYRNRVVICDKCGVQVTKAKVRRERMGHIELATPVSHIWYFKGIPSRMGMLLDISPKVLEKVLYFVNFIVLDPGNNDESKGPVTGLKYLELIDDARYHEVEDRCGRGSFVARMGAEAVMELLQKLDLDALSEQLKAEIAKIDKQRVGTNRGTESQKRIRAAKRLEVVEAFRTSGNKPEWMILTVLPVIPPDLRPMVQLEGGRFATSDLNDLYRRVINRNARLKRLLAIGAPDIIVRNEKRMLQESVDALIDNGRRGRPITGPGNRALKSLSDLLRGKQGRFRQNLLGKRVDYSGRSVIVVGPELKLHQCGLPKEMALELFKPFVMERLVTLKKAPNVKTARKRVDRASTEIWDILEEVIKDHPVLLNRAPTLHRLGIQAFEPVLVEGKAIKLHPLACTAFNADFDGDQMAVHVPLSLEAQAEARFLMLGHNNILKPQDGKPVIQPSQDMVIGCYYLTIVDHNDPHGVMRTVYTEENGEQVAHTVPVVLDNQGREVENLDSVWQRNEDGSIVVEKQTGHRVLMMGKDESRALRDSKGRLMIVLDGADVPMDKPGTAYVTDEDGNRMLKPGAFYRYYRYMPRVFQDMAEAEMAYAQHLITLQTPIRVRLEREFNGEKGTRIIDCTLGKLIFNDALPQNMGFKPRTCLDEMFDLEVDDLVGKKKLANIVDMCFTSQGEHKCAIVLDKIKALGYKYATRSATTVSVADIRVPAVKAKMLAAADEQVRRINNTYRRGLISEDGRYRAVIDIWTRCTEELRDQILPNLEKFNPIRMMTDSGARGSASQVSQLAGMRGLMASPSGKTVELPIRANFREGLNVLEFFLSSHGSRKALSDTALRTADSGYLTRRLVDVSQEVIVREEDCFIARGEPIRGIEVQELMSGKQPVESLEDRLRGRTAAEDILDPATGEVLVAQNQDIDARLAALCVAKGVKKAQVRSVLTCMCENGVCAKCYGMNMAHGGKVDIGEAVGIIAAQAIGEPGTQLTMRNFHSGGVAGAEDITQGLPRVEELFEARKPKHEAVLAEIDGIMTVAEVKNKRMLTITSETNPQDSRSVQISYSARLTVPSGSRVQAGDILVDGAVNPHDLMRIKGVKVVREYLLKEVLSVYRSQGVGVADKHIEIIVHQMLRKVRILDAGDTNLLPGTQVDKTVFDAANAEIRAYNAALPETDEEGNPSVPKRFAVSHYVLLGITKAALATESFLSAASFQETTKVLTEAAIRGKVDPLLGLKENVIIGKLIPAGTGLRRYTDIQIRENNY